MTPLKSHRTFQGFTQFWEHDSLETKTKMKFSTFIPDGKVHGALIFLSGLTCNEENFVTKAGAQRFLGEAGLMILCPDTSPRGLNLPKEHDSWDFGSGASFYVDATTPFYCDHYRMDSYVSKELHGILQTQFHISADRISVFGHSMGGHGALVMGLKYPDKFKSVSAFSPLVHPTVCPWGKRAMSGYLGESANEWKKYDATELVKSGRRHPHSIYIDQGTKDEFLVEQLLTADFEIACREGGQPLKLHYREGFDHSYYFISSFIADHILFHSQALAD